MPSASLEAIARKSSGSVLPIYSSSSWNSWLFGQITRERNAAVRRDRFQSVRWSAIRTQRRRPIARALCRAERSCMETDGGSSGTMSLRVPIILRKAMKPRRSGFGPRGRRPQLRVEQQGLPAGEGKAGAGPGVGLLRIARRRGQRRYPTCGATRSARAQSTSSTSSRAIVLGSTMNSTSTIRPCSTLKAQTARGRPPGAHAAPGVPSTSAVRAT